MLEITDSAQKELKKILEDAKLSSPGIRVFGSGGGCCGMSYGLGITEQPPDGDKLFEKNGLKIFIDPAVYDDLEKAIIDYADEERGFVIHGIQPGCSC